MRERVWAFVAFALSLSFSLERARTLTHFHTKYEKWKWLIASVGFGINVSFTPFITSFVSRFTSTAKQAQNYQHKYTNEIMLT